MFEHALSNRKLRLMTRTGLRRHADNRDRHAPLDDGMEVRVVENSAMTEGEPRIFSLPRSVKRAPYSGRGFLLFEELRRIAPKNEARIDWRRDAAAVRNHIHALSPAPGAYSEIDFGHGVERVKFFRARAVDGSGQPGEAIGGGPTIACGDGAIEIVEAQRPGKTTMSGAELARGASLAGARFS